MIYHRIHPDSLMKNSIFLQLAFFFLGSFSFAQSLEIQGQTYKTVKIGNQTWMAENLNVTKFNNGDYIPLAESEEDWFMAAFDEIPACIDVILDPENGKFFGKLYNYYAISDPRGIAPEGWRIPTDEDWNELAKALGGPAAATAKLKSTEGWVEENGTDESGFTAYPIGMIDMDGVFQDLGFGAMFWSISLAGELVLNRSISLNKFPFEHAESFKENGLSLRLIKND